jgi:hypothetical protein
VTLCARRLLQVAERVCEVWSQRLKVPTGKPLRAEVKLDALLECFHQHATVQPLHGKAPLGRRVAVATGGPQLRAALEAAATATLAAAGSGSAARAAAGPQQRAYVEMAGGADAALPTFCLDVYPPGAAPGFAADGCFAAGPTPQADAVAVLYRVDRSRVSAVWVGPAGDAAATAGASSEGSPGGGLAGSRLFVGPVLDLLCDAFGAARLSEVQVHVHDYTKIPTVG